MTDLLDLDSISAQERYKPLLGAGDPAPVAWVTTVDTQGVVNAAPYSFFNVFGQDPALIILGLQHKPDGSAKDTTRNIDATGEFVVNLATPALVKDMVGTASSYDPGESEPAALGLKLAPSGRVKPPRLVDAPVAIECERMMALSLSSERSILLGRAIGLATRAGLVDTATMYVDWAGDYPVARLSQTGMLVLEEIERFGIPEPYRPERNGEDRE